MHINLINEYWVARLYTNLYTFLSSMPKIKALNILRNIPKSDNCNFNSK